MLKSCYIVLTFFKQKSNNRVKRYRHASGNLSLGYKGKKFTVKPAEHVETVKEINVEDYVRNMSTALEQTFAPMGIEMKKRNQKRKFQIGSKIKEPKRGTNMKKKTSRLDEILREKFLKGEFDSIEGFKPTIVGINGVRVKIFLESWCSICFTDKEIKEVKGDTHCLENLVIEKSEDISEGSFA